jgi:MOSC domain-containing protein YiiM
MLHRTTTELEATLDELGRSPKDEGRLELIVRRPIKGQREVLDAGELTLEEGLAGDCWKNHNPHPDQQINIMNARAIAVIAGTKDSWSLAGDQLYIDMDLSETNLPPGTQLAMGAAVVEITAEPHTGCGKFAKRFGVDAMKFVNSPRGRSMNLRGLNARVVRPGVIRSGDSVVKVTHGNA